MDPADLGLDVDRIPICQACLSFVSMALDDPKEARHWTFRMTPNLWEEGLREPALEAVRTLGDRVALADLEEKGGRSKTARAIVMELARQQEERTRHWLQAMRNQTCKHGASAGTWPPCMSATSRPSSTPSFRRLRRKKADP